MRWLLCEGGASTVTIVHHEWYERANHHACAYIYIHVCRVSSENGQFEARPMYICTYIHVCIENQAGQPDRYRHGFSFFASATLMCVHTHTPLVFVRFWSREVAKRQAGRLVLFLLLCCAGLSPPFVRPAGSGVFIDCCKLPSRLRPTSEIIVPGGLLL